MPSLTVITFDDVEEPAAAVRPIVDWMAMLELPAPLVVGTTGAVGLEKAPAPLELRAASRNEMPLPAAKPVAANSVAAAATVSVSVVQVVPPSVDDCTT